MVSFVGGCGPLWDQGASIYGGGSVSTGAAACSGIYPVLILRAFAPFFPRGTTYRPHMILCLLHLEKKNKKIFSKDFQDKMQHIRIDITFKQTSTYLHNVKNTSGNTEMSYRRDLEKVAHFMEARGIQEGQVQRNQLRHPDSRSVEKFQHRLVTDFFRAAPRRCSRIKSRRCCLRTVPDSPWAGRDSGNACEQTQKSTGCFWNSPMPSIAWLISRCHSILSALQPNHAARWLLPG